ncbi:MAG TPA: hypothetical protein VGD58_21255 [Herpetosiphonaceae bacterium]
MFYFAFFCRSTGGHSARDLLPTRCGLVTIWIDLISRSRSMAVKGAPGTMTRIDLDPGRALQIVSYAYSDDSVLWLRSRRF